MDIRDKLNSVIDRYFNANVKAFEALLSQTPKSLEELEEWREEVERELESSSEDFSQGHHDNFRVEAANLLAHAKIKLSDGADEFSVFCRALHRCRLDVLESKIAQLDGDAPEYQTIDSKTNSDISASDNKRILNVKEAASLLNMSPITLRRKAKEGKIPGHKEDSTSDRQPWKFYKSDLETHLRRKNKPRGQKPSEDYL